MLHLLVLGTVSLLLAGDAKDDQKKLEGTWTAISAEMGGEKMPEDKLKNVKMTFAGDKVTFVEGNKPSEASYKVDPSKKPATIDVSPLEGSDKGKTFPGIYAFEGDTLKICLGEKERPTEFATKKGDKNVLVVMKRPK